MMPAVAVLAGGMATRLYPVTKTIPKSLIDINGQPFIHHQLNLLREKGITKVVLCLGNLGEQIQDFVGNGSNYSIDVQYSFDGDKLIGTGGAIKKAIPILGDEFFILYGDSYLDIDYKSIYEHYKKYEYSGLMTIIENHDKWDKSNVFYDNGKIIKYDKDKPDSNMKYIDYGLSLLKSQVFSKYSDDDIFDLSIVFKNLIDRSNMLGYIISTRFYEIGSNSGIEETKDYIKNRKK